MKKAIKIIAIILCFAMVLPLFSCGYIGSSSPSDTTAPGHKSDTSPSETTDSGHKSDTSPSETTDSGHNISIDPKHPGQYWENIPDDGKNTGDPSLWEDTGEPNINITVIGGEVGEKELNVEQDIEQDKIDSIYSLVCSAVSADLTEAGFECGSGLAETLENDNYTAVGIYYRDPDVNLFSNPALQSVGFVEIVSNEDPFFAPDREESIIAITDLTTEEDEVQKICAYNYENIGSYHFIYQDKYVVYYQQTPMRVVYTVYDNVKSNYDLSLGSLYDYDNSKYVYDETIFGEYQSHSGEELFGSENYSKLEADLQSLSQEQLKAGYVVSEFNIVYISPESITEYLLSDEEDTFFGYSVAELSECLGLGTALTYSTESGLQAASVIEPTNTSYNWKSFLIKMGIGTGIIIIGAVLTPITGGASFGCALLTITKVAVTFALTSAISTLAIETAVGMIQGKSIEESLRSATYSGLDAFANGFMIGAVIGSVGVVSGLIKPTACFVAGTAVVTGVYNGFYTYQNIETIKVGDTVLSYNEETGSISAQKVVDVFEKEVSELVYLTINSETIITTPNHPFYSADRGGWIPAGELKCDEKVLCADEIGIVSEVKLVLLDDPAAVYNFTVDNTHTYFVGTENTLVHNECTTLNGKRNKAVNDAWKREKEAVMNGTSKYNWTPKEIKELLKTGKIKGYAGHHIVPVNELIGTAKEALISSADDIVFLSKNAHVYVHAVGDTFEATIPRVLEIVPWIAERLPLLV